MPVSATLRPTLETLAVALAGGGVATALGLPASWLAGAMLGGALLLAAGRPLFLPASLRDLGMILAGVSMGAEVTPAMLAAIGLYPLSVALLLGCLVVTMGSGTWLLGRLFRWDRASALFASTPGALSHVLALAAARDLPMLPITTVQSVRLFLLVAVVPLLVGAGAPTMLARPSPAVADGWAFAAMMAAAVALAGLFARLRLAGAPLFGAFAASAALHGAGIVKGTLPAPLLTLSFVLVGAFIATRFTGVTVGALRRLSVASLVSFAASLAVCLVFVALTVALTGLPLGQVLVAFAPGGLEAMTILGMALGLDPLYVTLHHFVRFFSIAIGLPLLAPLLLRRAR